MRYWRKAWVPPFLRVLLIESGSRSILEGLIPGIYQHYGAQVPIDVVTCFGGAPVGLNPDTSRIFSIPDYGPEGKQQLLAELLERNYAIVGVICSAEPIMTKWKWWLAYHIPAKVFIVNENGDYFWVHLANWRIVLHFVLFRAGMTEAGAVYNFARLALLPLTFAYLASFAAWVHLKRGLRRAFGVS